MYLTLLEIRASFALVTPDVELFRKTYVQEDLDFIYDRTSQLFMVQILSEPRPLHEDVMALLYCHHSGLVWREDRKYDWSSLFISKGLGIFKSTAMPYVMASPDFDFTDLPFLRRDVHHVVHHS